MSDQSEKDLKINSLHGASKLKPGFAQDGLHGAKAVKPTPPSTLPKSHPKESDKK